MKPNRYFLDLSMVRAAPLVISHARASRLSSYRQACRFAWKLRAIRNMTQRTLAEHAGLYTSHCSDYFSLHENRRELPARHIAAVERVLGNTVISQWVAQQSNLTVLEGMHPQRRAA